RAHRGGARPVAGAQGAARRRLSRASAAPHAPSSVSTWSRRGSDGWAPRSVHASPAARPALNASPAAVVSTTATGSAGARTRPSAPLAEHPRDGALTAAAHEECAAGDGLAGARQALGGDREVDVRRADYEDAGRRGAGGQRRSRNRRRNRSVSTRLAIRQFGS